MAGAFWKSKRVERMMMMKNRMRVMEDIKKQQDEKLRQRVWAEANKNEQGCPFQNNRGYDPKDENCQICFTEHYKECKTCLEDSRSLPCDVFLEGKRCNLKCRIETQRRLTTIYNNLITELGGEDKDIFWESDTYLDAASGKIYPDHWFLEKRQEIRVIANKLIKSWGIEWDDLDPGVHLHPNTLKLFRNCFPEWLEFEEKLMECSLEFGMREFHSKEQEKAFRFSYPNHQEESDDIEIKELLIIENNWRGFDFESLFYQDNGVPKKIIKDFTRDYFKHREQLLKTEKRIARNLNLFGEKEEREKRWPKKWMLSSDNATIRKFIESKNGKFFCELMEYLSDNKMKRIEGEQVASKLNAGGNNYAVVQVDRKQAAKDLKRRAELKGISVHENKIHAFLKWMEKHDLIKKLGKPGKNEPMVYAIGKWVAFPDPETGEMAGQKVSFFVKYDNRQNLKKAAEDKIIW